MTLATALGMTLLGLLLLAGGGEALVRGAISIARMAGLTPAVIGLTVVAIGTSLPELVVSLLAARQGQPDLAVGNVVGSNILNIAGILALTALIAPIPVTESAIMREWPFMVLMTCLLVLLASDGVLGRVEGAMMVTALVGFIAFMVRRARAEFGAEPAAPSVSRSLLDRPAPAILAVAAGVTLLVLGGETLVSGAIGLARLAGLSERVIGLTIVAVGTSTPELAASLVAARRGRSDLAVANLMGSNIFNILGILGLTAMFRPLPVSSSIFRSDMVWMMVTAFALFPMLRTGRLISRGEGAVLLSLYAAYLFVLLR